MLVLTKTSPSLKRPLHRPLEARPGQRNPTVCPVRRATAVDLSLKAEAHARAQKPAMQAGRHTIL